MKQLPPPLLNTSLLVVEGRDDQRFWIEYLREVGRGDVEVLQTEGKHNLSRMLSALVLATDFSNVEWIGVVQDGDSDPRATFDRICGALRRAELTVPRNPWVAEGLDPTVVAFVLPDGTQPGDLEALLWEGLQGLPEADCISDFLECVQTTRGEHLPRVHKSRVYAYIATLDNPELRLSHSILRGNIDSDGFRRMLELFP